MNQTERESNFLRKKQQWEIDIRENSCAGGETENEQNILEINQK
jgi:hypothetical protein